MFSITSRDFETRDDNTVTHWTSVLRCALRWGFESVKRLALKHLRAQATPVEKILLARDLLMDLDGKEWMMESFVTLCEQPRFPTKHECQHLGMSDVHLIATVRESVQTCECTRTVGAKAEVGRHAKIIELLQEQMSFTLTPPSPTQPSVTFPLDAIPPTDVLQSSLPTQPHSCPSELSHTYRPSYSPPSSPSSKITKSKFDHIPASEDTQKLPLRVERTSPPPSPFDMDDRSTASRHARQQDHPWASNVERRDPDDLASLPTSSLPYYGAPANVQSEGLQSSVRFDDPIGKGQPELVQPDVKRVTVYLPPFIAADPFTTSPPFLSQELEDQAESDGRFNRGFRYLGEDRAPSPPPVRDERRQSTKKGKNRGTGQWTESNLEAFERRNIAAPSTRGSGFNPIIGSGRGGHKIDTRRDRGRGRGGTGPGATGWEWRIKGSL